MVDSTHYKLNFNVNFLLIQIAGLDDPLQKRRKKLFNGLGVMMFRRLGGKGSVAE